MHRFLLGFVLGLTVGVASAAFAAVVSGDSGHLSGWFVTKDGEEICSDPYVSIREREIEC